MTNKNTPGVTACVAYRSDKVVIRFAKELAAKHACPVHVGRFVNEDTGETSPAFLLGSTNPGKLAANRRLENASLSARLRRPLPDLASEKCAERNGKKPASHKGFSAISVRGG